MELQLAEPDAAQPDSLSFHYAGVSLVTPHDGHDRHLSGSGPAPSRMLIGPGAGPTGTSRATTELHGAVRSDTAGPCAGCAAVPAAVASTGTMFWARSGCCYASMQALGTIGPHPATHRPRDGASLARDPLGPGSLGTTPSHGPRAGRAAVGGGSEELRASVRDSEARLSGPTHLRMCIRVSAQAGPARSRCCGPARGPWAASGPEEAPRSCATRSGSFASRRRRMASHAVPCTSRHHRPRDQLGPGSLGTAGRERAAQPRLRAGGAARLGADLRVYISAPPAAPPQDPQEDRGAGLVCERKEELLDSERELRVDTCSAMHLGTAGRETRKGTALSAV